MGDAAIGIAPPRHSSGRRRSVPVTPRALLSACAVGSTSDRRRSTRCWTTPGVADESRSRTAASRDSSLPAEVLCRGRMRSNPPQWLFVFLLTSSATVVRAATPVYPFAERDSVVDDYHGVRVADPYRWLESLDAPRTREWLRAEAGFTVQQLDALPGREALRRRLTALRTVGHTGVPWREAGRLYFEESRGTDAQPEFCVADSLGATPSAAV